MMTDVFDTVNILSILGENSLTSRVKRHSDQTDFSEDLHSTEFRFPLAEKCRLIGIVEQQLRLPGDGFHSASKLCCLRYGLAGNVAATSETLLAVLMTFCELSKMSELLHLQLTELENVIQVDIVPVHGEIHGLDFFIEHVMASLFNVVNFESLLPLDLVSVGFTQMQPKNVYDFEQYFGCAAHFDCRVNHIRFNKAALQKAPVSGDRELHDLLLRPVSTTPGIFWLMASWRR